LSVSSVTETTNKARKSGKVRLKKTRIPLCGQVDYSANLAILKKKLKSLEQNGCPCVPIMTIYNTGGHLFMLQYEYRDVNKSPLSHFNANTPWQWMKYRRWSSDCVRRDSDRVVWFVSIDTHGHSGGIAGLTFKTNKDRYTCRIPRGGMIHVVDTYNSEIKIITEVRPLPLWIFDSIRSREVKRGVLV
jgi:hypothetical protein